LLSGALPLALAAWWLLPQGFPTWHPRFWVNQVLPWAVALAALVGLIHARRRPGVGLAVGVVFGGLALGAGAGSVLWFPLGGQAVAPALLIPGIYFVGVSARRQPRRVWAPTLAVGVALGALLPGSQRGPSPSTRPTSEPIPGPLPKPLADGPLVVDDGVTVSRSDGWVRLALADRPELQLNPLLRFHDRSPERGWTNLTRRRGRPPAWPLSGERRSPQDVRLGWAGEDGPRWLKLTPTRSGLQLAAWSQLPHPVYSHLNSFSELQVLGPGPFTLRFSPCPDAEVQVLPADYPTGRPGRLACLTEDGTLRVLEAASGEKGPFTELAAGPLARGDPLSVTVAQRGEPVCRVTWPDWAAQCSTELSPTAGWGLPQNALEFRLTDEGMSLWCTLAATSVGRGWDSVGHAAGAYRNRVTVEPAR
jgi:hypothetical protein